MPPFRPLTDLEKEVVSELVQCGHITGYEFVAVFDETGDHLIDMRTDRLADRSDIGVAAFAELRMNRRVVVRHNHPACCGTARSLSRADWKLLVPYPGIAEISAHGMDGTCYRGAVDINLHPRFVTALENLPEAANAADQHLTPPPLPQPTQADLDAMVAQEGTFEYRGHDPMDVAAPDLLGMHATNLAFAEAGLVDYEFDAGPRLQAFLARYATKLSVAKNAARKFF